MTWVGGTKEIGRHRNTNMAGVVDFRKFNEGTVIWQYSMTLGFHQINHPFVSKNLSWFTHESFIAVIAVFIDFIFLRKRSTRKYTGTAHPSLRTGTFTQIFIRIVSPFRNNLKNEDKPNEMKMTWRTTTSIYKDIQTCSCLMLW